MQHKFYRSEHFLRIHNMPPVGLLSVVISHALIWNVPSSNPCANMDLMYLVTGRRTENSGGFTWSPQPKSG